MEYCQMHPNTTRCTKTWVLVQWGGSGPFIVKILTRFHGSNLCLIAPVQPILHRVSCSDEILPNTHKHYEMHTTMSLSNGVDWVWSLWKIPKWLHGTNLCINCTSSTCFAKSSCSKETLPNAPKHYKTHQNLSLGSNGVDRFRSLRKILMRLHGTNFCISCTSSTRFVSSIVQ